MTTPITPTQNEIIGPYRLLEKIGSGEFGVVWKAEKYQVIAPPCAIKFPTREDVDLAALQHEAEVWVRASGHPNVLPMIEAGIYDGQLLIVSEYAQSGSMLDWLERHNGKAPTVERAIEMTMGILAGLDHLHRQHIVHRDLKPANIMLQGDIPRLADFGLARVIHTSQWNSKKVVGTVAYMAPEAFRNQRTEQADIWAVGVILYEMLSGWSPFDGADMHAFMWSIVNDPARPMPETIVGPLRQIVEKALEKDPSRRYQTATEMREALRRVLTREETARLSVPPSLPELGPNGRYSRIAFTTGEYLDERLIRRQEECDVFPLDLGSGVAVEMVRIRGGTFLMGSTSGEDGREPCEGPLHEVSVREFFLGRLQVTQRQWRAVASWPKVRLDLDAAPAYFRGEHLPIEQVSWEEAREFIARINRRFGLTANNGYRLPSEAEWEYAARAGSITPFAFGSRIGTEVVNYYGSGRSGQFRERTVRAGSLGVANPWGLYDMHGNVWEWCEDDWHDSYLGAPGDGRPWVDPVRGRSRVYRGGGYFSHASACRSAYRYSESARARFDDVGFRLARTLA